MTPEQKTKLVRWLSKRSLADLREFSQMITSEHNARVREQADRPMRKAFKNFGK
jgi:hypothetical protein